MTNPKLLKKWTWENIEICRGEIEGPIYLCPRCQEKDEEKSPVDSYLGGLNPDQVFTLFDFCNEYFVQDIFFDFENETNLNIEEEYEDYGIFLNPDNILPIMQKTFKEKGFKEAMKEGERIKDDLEKALRDKAREYSKMKKSFFKESFKELKSIIRE